MNEDRGPWYLLTGLALGIAMGLAYAWLISPVEYIDTPPASLRQEYRQQYRETIALAYAANPGLARARTRLALLGEADPLQALAQQAQQALDQAPQAAQSRALAGLAQALGASLPTPAPLAAGATASPSAAAASPPAGSTPLPSELPSPTVTPVRIGPQPTGRTAGPQAVFTPLPTRTPTPTPGAPFRLQSQELICRPELEQPLIQVQVLDAAGQPVAGVMALVSWQGGQERFFTGLKPELGLGYADFRMTPGLTYNLQLADRGELAPNLAAAECQAADGSVYWGSWLLTFVQP